MKIIILLAVVLGFAATSMAQNYTRASVTSSAFAEIIAPLTIVKNADLKVGKLSSLPLSGSVMTLTDAMGNFFANPGTAVSKSTSGIIAKFTVTGSDEIVTFDCPGQVQLTKVGGSETMQLVPSFTTLNATSDVPIASTGNQTFYLTGTLTVGINQAPGQYKNDTSLIIVGNYN